MGGGPGQLQLLNLIATIDDGGMALDGGPAVDLSGLLVTYVRGAWDSGVGLSSDSEGFFLQASPNGPAIFVEAADAGLFPGDLVSLRVLAAGRRTASAPRSVTEFTQLVRSSSGNPTSGFARDVSAVDFTQPALIDLYESRLVNVAGLAQGASVFSFGYRLINLQTAGVQDAGVIRLRMQAPAFDQQDFTAGCTISITGVPLWRIGPAATPTALSLSELTGSQCPAPNVVSAVPQSSTSVLVNFDRNMAPLTLSTVSLDGGASVVAVTANTPRQAALTTTPLLGQPYQLICAPSVVDLRGTPLATRVATFTGLTPPVPGCSPVVISQVYAGGGNTTMSVVNADFVELHNRTSLPVNVSGWSLQYQAATSTVWQPLFVLNATIPASGFLLVQAGGTTVIGTPLTPDLLWSQALGVSGGKVALVANSLPLDGGCGFPNAGIADYVGWGTTNCADGIPATAAGVTQTITRVSSCQDSDNNQVDFTLTTPNPRGLSSPGSACTLCQGQPDGG